MVFHTVPGEFDRLESITFHSTLDVRRGELLRLRQVRYHPSARAAGLTPQKEDFDRVLRERGFYSWTQSKVATIQFWDQFDVGEERYLAGMFLLAQKPYTDVPFSGTAILLILAMMTLQFARKVFGRPPSTYASIPQSAP